MFHSMKSLINGIKNDRERAHALLLSDKDAFESTISVGALCKTLPIKVFRKNNSVFVEFDNQSYQPEIAKMYRRLLDRIAYSERLLGTSRKTHVLG